MTLEEMAVEYNRQLRAAIETLYNALPPGQQRTILRDAGVRQIMVKYGIIDENND